MTSGTFVATFFSFLLLLISIQRAAYLYARTSSGLYDTDAANECLLIPDSVLMESAGASAEDQVQVSMRACWVTFCTIRSLAGQAWT